MSDPRDVVYGGGMRRRVHRRVKQEQLTPTVGTVVVDDELGTLPAPAQRWLRFMQVVGRPRVTAFEIRMRGRFRMRPGQRWMHCDAWQYNQIGDVARLFHMRLDFVEAVPMFGWDTYLRGRGGMQGRLAGIVKVVDGAGPEFDAGELVTWVNDACLLAPSMLLGPATSWSAVDSDTFDLVFTDHGMTVAARLTIDADGRLVKFVTDDRYCSLPTGLVRARWSTPIDAWTTTRAGQPIVSQGRAIWHLPDGEFSYVEATFDADTLSLEPTARTGHDFALTNRLANPILAPILRAPTGRLLGRRLALVDYDGARTGRHHELVTGYRTEGDKIDIAVGAADHKTWWRNFRTPHEIDLLLAGVHHHGVARAITDGGGVHVVVEFAPPATAE